MKAQQNLVSFVLACFVVGSSALWGGIAFAQTVHNETWTEDVAQTIIGEDAIADDREQALDLLNKTFETAVNK